MKASLILFAALIMFQPVLFSDEGASTSTDFSEWENDFRSSLDTLGKTPASPAPAPLSPREPERVSPMLSTDDVLAAKDLSVRGDARLERLENRVAQLERSLKFVEERQRNMDRSINDLQRRR